MLLHDDEIIVVDANSAEPTLDLLKKLSDEGKIKLLHSTAAGNRSHNRNLGAFAAKNSILLFVDGDMVLCPNALQVLRAAHAKGKAVAYIGPKHNMHYSDVHSSLFSGISQAQYVELLQTEDGRKQIMNNPMFHDERLEHFQNVDLEPFFWMHFYTGASSVEKDVFEAVGGFDESFTTWGSEDVDLGYRIAQKGIIEFLPQFCSIHIPHQKDVLKQETTNIQNTIKMLRKYKSWEFEVLYAFHARPEVFRSFKNILKQMRMMALSPMVAPSHPNTMEIHPVSSKHPNGLVVRHDSEGNSINLESIGIALDFPDNHFDTVYAADTIFLYPVIMTTRVMQELCRVSKRILILPTGETSRIDWSESIYFPPYYSNQRLSYRSDDIMDFRFHCNEDGVIEVKAEEMPVKKLQL
jgi:GT2 family glycosyltransferase